VIEYYRHNEAIEKYSNMNWFQQLIVGLPVANSPMRGDSSTGIGQIFARTAIEAHNSAIARGDISGQNIDYANINERKEVWYGLRSDETNIFYAGVVLRHKAESLGVNLFNASGSQIEQSLSRYNGSGDAAKEYGIETKQYYDLFLQYNK